MEYKHLIAESDMSRPWEDTYISTNGVFRKYGARVKATHHPFWTYGLVSTRDTDVHLEIPAIPVQSEEEMRDTAFSLTRRSAWLSELDMLRVCTEPFMAGALMAHMNAKKLETRPEEAHNDLVSIYSIQRDTHYPDGVYVDNNVSIYSDGAFTTILPLENIVSFNSRINRSLKNLVLEPLLLTAFVRDAHRFFIERAILSYQG